MTKKKPSVLRYLKDHLDLPHSKFLAEWKRLSEKDRTDLKAWAEKEIEIQYS